MNAKKKKHTPRFISKSTDKDKVNGEGFTYQVESLPQRNRKGYSISKQKEGRENRHGTKTLCLENQFASLKSYFVKVISASVYSRSIIP